MASTTVGLMTDGDASRRESLLSILRDVSPSYDNYLTSNLGRAPDATNTLHEWVVHNVARPTSNSVTQEGYAADYSTLAQPTRSNNITAIMTSSVRVSGTQRAIDHATHEDPYIFHKTEALKRLKSKMEYSTINGAVASGASGTARGMRGIVGCISTNMSALNSGTSFTEKALNDIMNLSWDAVGSDYVADLFLCPMVIKRRISGFTTNTRNVEAIKKRLTAEVQVYDSQVGQSIMILPHKDVNAAAGSLSVFAIREELFKYSFLTGREPMWQELAKDGDRDNGQYITELTLVSYAERASVWQSGFQNVL